MSKLTMEENMTATTHEGTGNVIPFPKGGRSGLKGGQYGATAPDLLTSMHVSYVDYGSCSYHDAAIRDEQPHHQR